MTIGHTCASGVPWMETRSGTPVNIFDPDPGTIRLADIAWGLARLPRFNGQTCLPWNVAAHSLLAEHLAPPGTPDDARLAILLHDAHEYVTGDIITPVKQALAAYFDLDIVSDLSRNIQRAIHIAAGIIASPDLSRDAIKTADMTALALERRELVQASGRDWGIPLPDVSRLRLERRWCSSKYARRDFTARCRTLIQRCGTIPAETFIAGLYRPQSRQPDQGASEETA